MRTRTTTALLALALGTPGFAPVHAEPPSSSPGDRGRPSSSAGQVQPRQTSDGLPGEVAAPLAPTLRWRPVVSRERSWRVARGVRYRRFDSTDPRGRYRVHVLDVDVGRPRVRLDYASPSVVTRRARLPRLLRRDGAVAGVNGGFFDIHDTGAPLGVGLDRQRGFLHAAKYTWTNAFATDRSGRMRIGPVVMRAGIAEHPEIEITNVNSPRVRAGKVGVYTRAWGTTSGYSVTDGQRRNVRAVWVEQGRVVARSTRLDSGEPIEGTLLLGRGRGAEQLAGLRIGTKVSVTASLPERYTFAISGETVLLRGGRVRARDDVYLHPRTAVGIDRDTGHVLLVAVDGRQEHSRGLTLVELARLMRRLGAESALNLDGGGSTTLAGRGRDRTGLRVLNSPSDGSPRPIPDGIAVLAR